MVSPHLRSSITDLLLDAGISTEEMEVAPLDGGANNKVFSVHNKKLRTKNTFVHKQSHKHSHVFINKCNTKSQVLIKHAIFFTNFIKHDIFETLFTG